jgi:aminoglycoside phosphotransferase (APT) family kinase protein
LQEHFGADTEVFTMERLGRGIHGIAYRLNFSTSAGPRSLIMKTLFPSGFGHDHYSDRAQVLLLAHANYNEMERHIGAVDVVGEGSERFISLKDAGEFYLFMEEARGQIYFKDFDEILDRDHLERENTEQAEKLAHLLSKIHRVKYRGEKAKTLYRRRIRDLVGHGECIMGMIDTYDSVPFISDEALVDYAKKCVSWWGKIRNRSERLCQVHGDFHPGNIRFHDDEVILMDRSRGTWGEPADDLSCLAINYIHYALKKRSRFEGPFAELFRAFIETYLQDTNDWEILEVIAPFFAFRILVLANPTFFPNQKDEERVRLLGFGRSVLEAETFEPEKVSSYLQY